MTVTTLGLAGLSDRALTAHLSALLDADEYPGRDGRRTIHVDTATITAIGARWVGCVWDLLHHGWAHVEVHDTDEGVLVQAWPQR